MTGNNLSTHELIEKARRFGTDLADVEIKSGAHGLPTSIVDTISAFANGSGGTIIIGLVEADGFTPAEEFDPKKTMDALAGVAADSLEPPVRDPVVIEDFEGRAVVRMDVSELDPVLKPCFVRTRGEYNGSFIRGGDGDRRLTRYEVTLLLSNRRQPTDDLEPVPTADMTDLSDDLLVGLLSRVRARNRRAFGALSDEQCLVRLGAAVDVEGTLHPTLAGLLALGQYPQQFRPQLFISFVAVPGLEMGDRTPDGRRFLDNQTLDGPLPEMIEDAVSAVERNMRRAVAVQGARRTDHYDYPIEAVRELIVNAVMHRDYSADATGTQVQVELYPDRLVVKNPGGLYGGVEVGQLGVSDVSSSRNSGLAKLLGELPGPLGEAVCENRGSGLPSVMRALRDAGMSPPEFVTTPAHVFVSVPRQALLSPDVIEWIGSLPARGLTDAQHLALAMMRTNGSVSNEMLRVWGVERQAATAALTDLVSRGLSVKLGGRRYASYKLAALDPNGQNPSLFEIPAPAAPRGGYPTVEIQLVAVTEAIRAGHVTSRAIAAQLGLTYETTIRRIRRLRDDGVIEETAARHSRAQSYRLLVAAPARSDI